MNSIHGLDGLRCEYTVPGSGTTADAVSRWSDTKISSPALIVTPNDESDVKDVIRIAKDNNLSVTVAGGGHGTFVEVNSQTIYLNMKNFKTVTLDKTQGTVRVGGGVVTGELLKALAAEGYYTPLPNSNAVGVVGCILGGGSTPLNGLHGWMADIVVAFRVITSDGKAIEVNTSSTGVEADLFRALSGAGHGLGVVTAVTTSAFPIASLNMTENSISLRSLIFPAPAIEKAAQAFLDMSCPSPEVSVTLTFVRSPPGTPAAGAPIIILGSTNFGPTESNGKTTLFQEDLVGKAVRADTESLPMANLNDRFDPHNVHGGHKAIASCQLKKTNVDTIKEAFSGWVYTTDCYPDAQRSIMVISAFDTKKHLDLGTKTNGRRFLSSRDRGITAMAITICAEEGTSKAMLGFLDNTMDLFRKADAGEAPKSFPNNLRFGMSLEEMFEHGQLEELREIKKAWDADGIFWSPYES